jgi:hypothetical protein
MIAQRDTQLERLFYLELLVLFTGRVGRKDLVSRFGISEPAATKDLTLYAELAPRMMRYDLKQKCYVFAEASPYFDHQVDQALFSLAGERAIALDTEHGKRLPNWVNCSIKRKMPLSLVASITRCMYQNRMMVAEYASLSSGYKERLLSPLALVNDGLRWHIRCFDHEHREYRDYNLARFNKVEEGNPSDVSLEGDVEWNSEVVLQLVPHPKATHPETICVDYDITEDVKCVSLRACLIGYFLSHWHIDCSDTASGDPMAQHLFLKNKVELMHYKAARWALNS